MKRRNVQPIYATTYRHQRWWHRLTLILLVAVVLGGAWFAWQKWQSWQQRQLAAFPVHGLLIDQTAGYVDFQQVASQGNRFVYLKATSGATFVDDNFADNFDRAQGAALSVGVLHTFSFSSSAQAQFTNVTQVVGNDRGQLPVAIQIGYYGHYGPKAAAEATQRTKLKRLINLLQNYYGGQVILQATPQVVSTMIRPTVPHQPIWLVTNNLQRPSGPVKFMTYRQNAHVNVGTAGQAVDLVVFNRTSQAYRQFISGT